MEPTSDNSTFFNKKTSEYGTKHDLSFSMIVDDRSQSQTSFNKMQPRTRTRWVEDNSVSKCSCGAYFGFLVWKSHCRMCGNLFCSACISQKTEIPKFLNTPTPAKGKEFDEMQQVKVCKECFDKVKQIKNIQTLVEVFTLVDLDIPDFKRMGQVCKMWNQLSNFYLSKIREIQYTLPTHKYDKYEANALWINREHFIGHNIWMTHLLRSINFSKSPKKKAIVLELLRKHKNFESKNKIPQECWELMCTRRCQRHLTSECALMLLDPQVNLVEIREYAMDYLLSNRVSTDELCCYIQYLVQAAIGSNHTIIIDRLLLEANNFEVGRGMDCEMNQRCIRILTEIYNEIQIGIKSKSMLLVQKYQELYEKLEKSAYPPFYNILMESARFTEIVDEYCDPNNPVVLIKKLAELGCTQTVLHPDLGTFEIDAPNVEVKKSLTKPVVIPMTQTNSNKKVMAMKKNEDIRKDQIVLNIIKLMKLVLKEELGDDFGIVTFRTRPTSPDSGFIEIVQNCQTLYSIKNKQMTLMQHILEKNPDSTAKEIQNRFIKSCSAYCVISYLLGVGDRHLDNIMITDDGRLFHIDYGFILGKDPKLLKLDHMRITPEMLDALGGANSESFEKFKKMCDEIYNTLRRNLNLFACLLNCFAITNPKIDGAKYFTEYKILREIAKRFSPGENYKSAKVQLHTRIDNSTTTTVSLKYAAIDWFHKHNKEQTVKNVITSTATGTFSVTKNLMAKAWEMIGIAASSDLD